MQPSNEVELDALLSSTSGVARPSATMAKPFETVAELDTFIKLQELLSLSTSQVLQRKGLDSIGECLNDLTTGGLLSTENVIHLSKVLERTRQYFTTFERVF